MDIAFTGIFFLVLSIIVFFLDKNLGTKWNKTWYNLTHKDPHEGEFTRGFVAGRGIQSRLGVAIFLSVLVFVLTFFSGVMPAIQAFTFSLLGILASVIGFYICGFLFGGKTNKLNDAMEYIEKVEQGEADLKADALEKAKKVGQDIKDTHDRVVQREKEAPEEITEIEAPKVEPKPEVKPEPPSKPEDPKDWRKGIDDFMNK